MILRCLFLKDNLDHEYCAEIMFQKPSDPVCREYNGIQGL